MSKTPAQEDTVQFVTDDEVQQLVQETLDRVGIDLATLRSFAEGGRFDTEQQRRAWFLISGVGQV